MCGRCSAECRLVAATPRSCCRSHAADHIHCASWSLVVSGYSSPVVQSGFRLTITLSSARDLVPLAVCCPKRTYLLGWTSRCGAVLPGHGRGTASDVTGPSPPPPRLPLARGRSTACSIEWDSTRIGPAPSQFIASQATIGREYISSKEESVWAGQANPLPKSSCGRR